MRDFLCGTILFLIALAAIHFYVNTFKEQIDKGPYFFNSSHGKER